MLAKSGTFIIHQHHRGYSHNLNAIYKGSISEKQEAKKIFDKHITRWIGVNMKWSGRNMPESINMKELNASFKRQLLLHGVKQYEPSSLLFCEGFPDGSVVKHLLAMQEMQEIQVRSLGRKDPLEEEMATHSSSLARKFPWTEEHGRIQSIGSHRVGCNWAWMYTSAVF